MSNFNILALNTPSCVATLYTVVTMATIMMIVTINTYVKRNAKQCVTVTIIKYYQINVTSKLL
jgi:hypothetical protein